MAANISLDREKFLTFEGGVPMQGGDTMAIINAIWPFLLMGGIFYFMLYRPQKQEQQKRQRMLDSLKKGDKVVTIGGMFGVIAAISEKKVTLKLTEGVEVEFARSAISAFQDPVKQEMAEK